VIIRKEDLLSNAYYKKASMKKGFLCPACGKDHDNESDNKLTIYQTSQKYKIRCFRARSDGQESVYTINVTKEQKQEMKRLLEN
jgi:hypothetical protein